MDIITPRGCDCTYVGDHGQVPGSGDSCLGRARVLGADEGDGLVEVLLRHAADGRQRVCLVVDEDIVEVVAGQHLLVGVDVFEGVDERSDEVLILPLVAAQRRQEAQREVLGVSHAEDDGQRDRSRRQSRHHRGGPLDAYAGRACMYPSADRT